MRRPLVAVWAVLGACALLVQAIVRLSEIAWDALSSGISAPAWAGVLAWCVANAYMEGYRGFQRRWVPRLVDRAVEIAERGPTWQVILAPVVAMGFVAAPRARIIANWVLLALVTGIVLVARQLPPVWRGGLDAGVVVGLGWGVIAALVRLAGALRRGPAHLA